MLLAHASFKGWFFDIRGAGQLGVMLFFALSGFLMAHHYLPGRATPAYWAAFLVRRFFRVYPTFFVATLLLWIAYRSGARFAGTFTGERLLAHWVLLEGSSIFWTVIVEMKFYAVFPLLGLLAMRIPARLVPAGFALAWLVSLAVAPGGGERLRLLPHLPYFVGGIAMGSLSRVGASAVGTRWWSWLGAGCLAVLALFVPHSANLVRAAELDPWTYPWRFVPLMALTVVSIAHADGAVRWLFANRAARFVGRISYSLYLVNSYVFSFLQPYVTTGPVAGCVVGVSAAVLVAWGLYAAIERPANAFGRRWADRLLAG